MGRRVGEECCPSLFLPHLCRKGKELVAIFLHSLAFLQWHVQASQELPTQSYLGLQTAEDSECSTNIGEPLATFAAATV